MSIRRCFKLLTMSMSMIAASYSGSALADVPNYVRIVGITYAGSGCPAGSVGNNVSPDFQAFTLLFDQYQAAAGPGVPFGQKRKNCQVNVSMDIPNGWSYTLFTVDTRGYVSLQPGVRAMEQSTYYFQGQQLTGREQTVIYGPTDRNYQATDQITMANQVWSPCGVVRSLNINTEVRVDNSAAPNNQGMMTVDSIDGQFKLIYGIRWRRCS